MTHFGGMPLQGFSGARRGSPFQQSGSQYLASAGLGQRHPGVAHPPDPRQEAINFFGQAPIPQEEYDRMGRTQETVAGVFGQARPRSLGQVLILGSVGNMRIDHFRILPPVEGTEADFSGVQVSILRLFNQLPDLQPEGSSGRMVEHAYETKYTRHERFGQAASLDMDFYKTEQGRRLATAKLRLIMDNMIILAKMTITSTLLRCQDRFLNSIEDPVENRQAGRTIIGRLQTVDANFARLRRGEKAWYKFMDDVKRVSQTMDTAPNYDGVLVPTGVRSQIAWGSNYETEANRRGLPQTENVLRNGADAFNTSPDGNILVVEEPSYRLHNSGLHRPGDRRPVNLLVSKVQVGRCFFIGNDVSPDDVDTKYRRSSYEYPGKSYATSWSGSGALGFLNFDQGDWRLDNQSYDELVRNAMCFDQKGELNRDVYSALIYNDGWQKLAERIGIEWSAADRRAPALDPFLVWSNGHVHLVRIAGNQSLRQTTNATLEEIARCASKHIQYNIRAEYMRQIEDMMALLDRNYNVSYDNRGDVEAFLTAVAWYNRPGADVINQTAHPRLFNELGATRLPPVSRSPTARKNDFIYQRAGNRYLVKCIISQFMDVSAGGPIVPRRHLVTRAASDATQLALIRARALDIANIDEPFNDQGVPVNIDEGNVRAALADTGYDEVAVTTALDRDLYFDPLMLNTWTTANDRYAQEKLAVASAFPSYCWMSIDSLSDAVIKDQGGEIYLRAGSNLPGFLDAVRRTSGQADPGDVLYTDAGTSWGTMFEDYQMAADATAIVLSDPSVARNMWRTAITPADVGPADMDNNANVPGSVISRTVGRLPRDPFLRLARVPSDSLPGFSTISAARVLAQYHLTGRANGWEDVESARKAMQTCADGITALEEYLNRCDDLWNAGHDGHEDTANAFFRERALPSFQRVPGNRRLNERTAVAQALISHIRYEAGIVDPFYEIDVRSPREAMGVAGPDLRQEVTLRMGMAAARYEVTTEPDGGDQFDPRRDGFGGDPASQRQMRHNMSLISFLNGSRGGANPARGGLASNDAYRSFFGSLYRPMPAGTHSLVTDEPGRREEDVSASTGESVRVRKAIMRHFLMTPVDYAAVANESLDALANADDDVLGHHIFNIAGRLARRSSSFPDLARNFLESPLDANRLRTLQTAWSSSPLSATASTGLVDRAFTTMADALINQSFGPTFRRLQAGERIDPPDLSLQYDIIVRVLVNLTTMLQRSTQDDPAVASSSSSSSSSSDDESPGGRYGRRVRRMRLDEGGRRRLIQISRRQVEADQSSGSSAPGQFSDRFSEVDARRHPASRRRLDGPGFMSSTGLSSGLRPIGDRPEVRRYEDPLLAQGGGANTEENTYRYIGTRLSLAPRYWQSVMDVGAGLMSGAPEQMRHAVMTWSLVRPADPRSPDTRFLGELQAARGEPDVAAQIEQGDTTLYGGAAGLLTRDRTTGMVETISHFARTHGSKEWLRGVESDHCPLGTTHVALFYPSSSSAPKRSAQLPSMGAGACHKGGAGYHHGGKKRRRGGTRFEPGLPPSAARHTWGVQGSDLDYPHHDARYVDPVTDAVRVGGPDGGLEPLAMNPEAAGEHHALLADIEEDRHNVSNPLTGGHSIHMPHWMVPNEHFDLRWQHIQRFANSDWHLRCQAILYLGMRICAEAIIRLRKRMVPGPMTLIPFDPFIDMEMRNAIFFKAGRETGQLTWFLQDLSITYDGVHKLFFFYVTMWMSAMVLIEENVLHVPNVDPHRYEPGGGGGGRIIAPWLIGRPDDDDDPNLMYDPQHPELRKASRFIAYGGGSLKRSQLPNPLPITGSYSTQGCRLTATSSLPLGRIGDTDMLYPSALVVNNLAEFYRLNSTAPEEAMCPRSLQDRIDTAGAVYNTLCYQGNQWAWNKAKYKYRRVYTGTGALGELAPGVGQIFNDGSPGIIDKFTGTRIVKAQ